MLLQDGIVRYELGKLECVLHVMKLHELEHVGSELVHYVQHVKCDEVQQLQGHGQHEQCVLDHALNFVFLVRVGFTACKNEPLSIFYRVGGKNLNMFCVVLKYLFTWPACFNFGTHLLVGQSHCKSGISE